MRRKSDLWKPAHRRTEGPHECDVFSKYRFERCNPTRSFQLSSNELSYDGVDDGTGADRITAVPRMVSLAETCRSSFTARLCRKWSSLHHPPGRRYTTQNQGLQHRHLQLLGVDSMVDSRVVCSSAGSTVLCPPRTRARPEPWDAGTRRDRGRGRPAGSRVMPTKTLPVLQSQLAREK